MTVDELIAELQAISAAGQGGLPVVLGQVDYSPVTLDAVTAKEQLFWGANRSGAAVLRAATPSPD